MIPCLTLLLSHLGLGPATAELKMLSKTLIRAKGIVSGRSAKQQQEVTV